MALSTQPFSYRWCYLEMVETLGIGYTKRGNSVEWALNLFWRVKFVNPFQSFLPGHYEASIPETSYSRVITKIFSAHFQTQQTQGSFLKPKTLWARMKCFPFKDSPQTVYYSHEKLTNIFCIFSFQTLLFIYYIYPVTKIFISVLFLFQSFHVGM